MFDTDIKSNMMLFEGGIAVLDLLYCKVPSRWKRNAPLNLCPAYTRVDPYATFLTHFRSNSTQCSYVSFNVVFFKPITLFPAILKHLYCFLEKTLSNFCKPRTSSLYYLVYPLKISSHANATFFFFFLRVCSHWEPGWAIMVNIISEALFRNGNHCNARPDAGCNVVMKKHCLSPISTTFLLDRSASFCS